MIADRIGWTVLIALTAAIIAFGIIVPAVIGQTQ